jgi:hypothetical protein
MEGDGPLPDGYVSDTVTSITSDTVPSASDPPACEKAAARKRAKEEANIKQLAFIGQCTLEDVEFDLTALQSFRGSTKTTALKTIKGVSVNQLGFGCIQKFCIMNKIDGWRGKSKIDMCCLIVERKCHANLDQVMYLNDFQDEDTNPQHPNNDSDDDTVGDGRTKKKKRKKLTKGAKPREITRDGSLYRVILVYFLQELRPIVLQLGMNPTAVQLGTGGFLHEQIYNKKLAHVYNDASRDSLSSSFATNHDLYISCGVPEDYPSKFDNLSALAFSQAMNFINNHYRVTVRNQQTSGCHKEFHCYCGQRPYLLLYHDLINESGGKTSTLGNMAFPKLPAGIVRSSLDGKEILKLTPTKRAASSERKENAGDKLVAVRYFSPFFVHFSHFSSNLYVRSLYQQVSIERN